MTHIPNFTLCASSDAVGTSRRGLIHISYAQLKNIFGGANRTPSGDAKVECQWAVVFPDGCIATIYNYKNGPIYMEDDSVDLTKNMTWHIGGHTPLAVVHILHTVNAYEEYWMGNKRKYVAESNHKDLNIRPRDQIVG